MLHIVQFIHRSPIDPCDISMYINGYVQGMCGFWYDQSECVLLKCDEFRNDERIGIGVFYYSNQTPAQITVYGSRQTQYTFRILPYRLRSIRIYSRGQILIRSVSFTQ